MKNSKPDKDKKEKSKINLKVLEAYTRDVARGIARIDYDSMDSISVSTGDVIEIFGKRKTHAKCLPLYPSDEGKAIIRIDGLIRTNTTAAVGDLVYIQKVKSGFAEDVVVVPLEAIPPLDERYLADALEGIPITKDDVVFIPYFGGKLSFRIVKIKPQDIPVVVTAKTVFHFTTKVLSPEEEKYAQIVEKMDAQIKQLENEITQRAMNSTLNDKEILELFQKITTLNKMKKYFLDKIE